MDKDKKNTDKEIEEDYAKVHTNLGQKLEGNEHEISIRDLRPPVKM